MDGEMPDHTIESLLEQRQALLTISEALATQRDLPALLRELSQRLRAVVDFDASAILLYVPDRDVMRAHLIETEVPVNPPLYGEIPVDAAPGGWVWKNQRPILIGNLAEERQFQRVSQMLLENGIKSYCALPLNSGGARLGALAFTSLKEEKWDESDLELLQQVANLVGVAVENALNAERVLTAQRQLAKERDRSRLLLEVNNAVVSHLNLPELLAAVSASLHRLLPNEFVGMALYDAESDQLRVQALDHERNQRIFGKTDLIPLKGTGAGKAFLSRKTLLVRSFGATDSQIEVVRRTVEAGLKSSCHAPLVSRGRSLGTLDVMSIREDAFGEEEAELLGQIANQIAIAVENALAYREIEALKNKLNEEKLYLEEEIQTTWNFEQIVGNSATIKRILKQVETVAPSDSTVLIRGETGTGKELIARSIHNLSGRRERTLVKLNCAAIPTGLLESELFGHEKGAFTGAIAQRIGRFELAHRGTIFLDEVGDIPAELQPKLLRVLQEQEFERLGSARTQRVDVRVVAATNCDLEEMVAAKQFRSDLFYRLNVFPVTLPPLRERREDIPLLARFFAQKFSQRMHKQIEAIPAAALSALMNYHWPGNIRELENVIERAVLLTSGRDLEIPIHDMKPAAKASASGGSGASGNLTLENAEREHILRVLRETEWVVSGPAGAAARLGMNRSTLQSRMRKLGISRPK
jgi:formate hydrogenlyase transcriptional activator